jgi:hypothetical protein
MHPLSVECPFCYNPFILFILDFQGERTKYKLLRSATCGHCLREIIAGSRLIVLEGERA